MKIDEIWHELEKDSSVQTGYLFRRYSGDVHPEVYVALTVPEKLRCVAASFPASTEMDLAGFSNLKDIKLEEIRDPRKQDRKILIFKLLNISHKEVFSILCEDLMLNIGKIDSNRSLATTLLERFQKWKSLFDKVNSPGLTAEQQHGLYAELFLLRKMLNSKLNEAMQIVKSWVGPSKQIKDFQIGPVAIEVKCTTGNNHQRIHINGERQLDISNLEALYLYHLSVELRQKNGETLVSLVTDIQNLLNDNLNALSRFESAIMEAGYFKHHRDLYEQTGYIVRTEFFYGVRDEFPRIEEKDLRLGVGDVKYSIIASDCADFVVAELDVFKKFICI
jgi:hypothetical protein